MKFENFNPIIASLFKLLLPLTDKVFQAFVQILISVVIIIIISFLFLEPE